MFLPDQWHALSYSTRPEGSDISNLVSYQESFWIGVEEVFAFNKPLVKVLCLVDRDKPRMGYLYDAMDRAKESICAYYQDKREEGY